MRIKLTQFFAIVFVALYLVPSGAHLIALPNKIGLDPADYMTVQQIYRGWALAGLVLLGALVSTLSLAVLSRSQRTPFRFATAGFLLMLAATSIFFVWVFPANQATENWTRAPGDLEALRAQWEYGHAAAAVAILMAFLATVLSSLTWAHQRST